MVTSVPATTAEWNCTRCGTTNRKLVPATTTGHATGASLPYTARDFGGRAAGALERAPRGVTVAKLQVTTPEALPEETGAEAALRPSRLDEFIGQEQVKASLQIAIDAARRRRETLDHTLFFGPPGLGQDHPRHADGPRDGRAAPHHLRPGAGEAGRPRRPPHQPRHRRHPLHRRDPPAAPGAGGIPLSRDGGLPGRRADRDGPERADDPDDARAVHADRAPPRASACSPRRCGRASAWSSGSASIPPTTWSRSSIRSAAHSQACRSTRGRGGDRAAQPRHAARGQPPAPAGARLRPGAAPTGTITARWPTTRSHASTSTSSGSTTWTPASSRTIIEKFGGGPVGLDTVAVAVGEDAGTLAGGVRAVPHPAGVPRAHAARPLRHRTAYRRFGLTPSAGQATIFDG